MCSLEIYKSCMFLLVLTILIVYIYYSCLNYKKTSLHTYLSTIQKNSIRIRTSHKVVFYYSHDYLNLPEYTKYSIDCTRQYCKLHKYDLIIKDHSKDRKISAYWLRVFDALELMREYPPDTIIIYLDLDTMINPTYFNIDINRLLNAIDYQDKQIYSIYIGRDQNIFNIVNTGVFFIRNNMIAHSIIKKWSEQYTPSVWSLQKNKWVCTIKNRKECTWAKDEYEQGELSKMYSNNILNTKKHIKILHTSICANKHLSIDSFIYHFMGGKNNTQNYRYLYNLIK